MGLLTDFYVLSRARAGELLESPKLKGVSTYTAKSIDTVKLSTLEKLLAKALKAKGPKPDTAMLTDEEAELWVLLVSPFLVELLARSEEVRPAVAKAWAATAELKADGLSVKQAEEVLTALAKLAAEANKKGTDVLLRMSL